MTSGTESNNDIMCLSNIPIHIYSYIYVHTAVLVKTPLMSIYWLARATLLSLAQNAKIFVSEMGAIGIP